MKKIAIFAAVMVVGAGVALASSLSVPFFFSDLTFDGAGVANGGAFSFVGVNNGETVDQTITVVYTSVDASGGPVSETTTFVLPAKTGLSFDPVVPGTAMQQFEGTGSIVPNMTVGDGQSGSLTLTGTGKLTGRFFGFSVPSASANAYVLIDTTNNDNTP